MRDSSTLDSVTVQASRKEEEVKQMSFMANDLCVLIPAEESRDRVELALLRGDAESSLRKHGLVGHVEFCRDSLDGLLLKVSKRWWATVGMEDMYLWKLGSNITALRVFAALCRVESIPKQRNQNHGERLQGWQWCMIQSFHDSSWYGSWGCCPRCVVR
jgi:hypothetical protein